MFYEKVLHVQLQLKQWQTADYIKIFISTFK